MIGPKNYTSGDYVVGTECFTVIDESREETLGEGIGPRKISVRMYYPVSKEDIVGKEKAHIFSDQKAKQLKKTYFVPKVSEEMNTADYYDNAPYAEGKFPLILFSHGLNAYIEANTYLCCDLASRGYIIASVGHTYEAIDTDFDDGSFAIYDKKLNKKLYTKNVFKVIKEQNKIIRSKGTPEQLYQMFREFQDENCPYIRDRVKEWAKDMMFAYDNLKIRYATWIDFEAGVGASGHSLGGACAYYLSQHYEEITCGINIDGGVFGNYDGLTMKRPFLQMCCELNYNVATRPLLDTKAPVYYAIFKNMQHIGFTDAKFYVPIKAVVGKLDKQVLYDNLFRLHINFFDKYLKQKDVNLKEREVIG